MIIPEHYKTLQVLSEGVMPDRAYYIPASERRDDLVENRVGSDRFQLLNGEWKFKYYSDVHQVIERFYELGAVTEGFDTIPVPSVWQNHGYDRHQYTNLRYPFPADPPHLPWEIPCGCYVTTFQYAPDASAPRAYLNFEGVDSCLYAWLNGTYLGYNEISHSTTEFDITDALVPGENTLAVLVLKWCTGSYLEDQDKFRTSGIFRDVYILRRPENHLRDYFVTNRLDEGSAQLQLRFAFLEEAVPVRVQLLDKEGKVVCQAEAERRDPGDGFTHMATMSVSEPVLWNPEAPYLYTLVIRTPGEVITDRWGFRQVSIRDNCVLLNGSPIKFRGVNRHDSDPVTGPVISTEQMKRDLRLMKEFNFNAIRTSHYPNSPIFYQLCDRYGFMVIDEADHESHGAIGVYRPDKTLNTAPVGHWNEMFADDPDYLDATVTRAKRCVIRDKNRPCVIIWSMGNECAYGCCFEAALAWTKAFDPTRLTHYEGARHHSDKRKYDFSNLDLYSTMYPSLQSLRDYVDSDPDKPYIMCEYAHAMGNSPGDLEDYWQFIQAHPVMSGGFVWEWCDHAVYKGLAPNGKPIFFYGGDHGEYPHDSNFCVDGLMYPDRRPHTGVLEYKNVNRPARVVDFCRETGTVRLHNYMDFVSLEQYATVHFAVSCDGTEIQSGRVETLPHIAPHSEGEFVLKLDIPEKGQCYLKLTYRLKQASEMLPEGFQLGFDEIPLETRDGRNQNALALCRQAESAEGELTLEETERYITLRGKCFTYRYDKSLGSFDSMVFADRELLNKPIHLNIWHAPTDNERKLKLHWYSAKFDKAFTRAYDTETAFDGNRVCICTDASVTAMSIQRILTTRLTWTVSPGGAVTFRVVARRNPSFPELPRFGLRLFLPDSMEQVTYCGLGPTENYTDKRHATSHGVYETTVAGLYEDYIRPQENGARGDCRYVALEDEKLRLTAVSLTGFSFNASHYTQEELTEKAHNYELQECGSSVLCLDYRHNGIGSASCGTTLLRQYALADDTLELELCLIPEAK